MGEQILCDYIKTIESFTQMCTITNDYRHNTQRLPTKSDAQHQLDRATASALYYINVENIGVSLGVDPQYESTTFWNKLIAKYLDSADQPTKKTTNATTTQDAKSKTTKESSANRVEL